MKNFIVAIGCMTTIVLCCMFLSAMGNKEANNTIYFHATTSYEYDDSTTYEGRTVDTIIAINLQDFTYMNNGKIESRVTVAVYNHDSIELVTHNGKIDRVFITHMNSNQEDAGIGYYAE